VKSQTVGGKLDIVRRLQQIASAFRFPLDSGPPLVMKEWRLEMYSPRISEALIPVLYRLRCHRRIPMTKLVHQLLLKALESEQLPDDLRAMLVSGGTESQGKAA